MSDEDLEDELGIKPGATIESSKAVYIIDHMLGEGGFGAVFLVRDEKNKDKEYALKVERKMDTRRHSKLKMEIAILKSVKEAREKAKNGDRFLRHYTEIIDRGKKEKYFFLIMQLVGKSLQDLKVQRPDRVFSIGTGLSVSAQCLEAVEGLHLAGYIHRDLKPANYACGTKENSKVIYILDFGISRMYVKKTDSGKSEFKTPRQVVGFKGTVRFASRACHAGREMGPKDDVESWFYLLVDCIVSYGLPWRKETDKKVVYKIKLDILEKNNPTLLFRGIKGEGDLYPILHYLKTLEYVDMPDYEYLLGQLKIAAKTAEVDMDAPYDWEREPQKSTMGTPT